MNTTLLLNNINNVPMLQAQQTQGTATTDGFLNLLNMLLDGLASQDSKVETASGMDTTDADNPEVLKSEDDTELCSLMAQSLLSSAQLLQYIKIDTPTATSDMEAKASVSSGETQAVAVDKTSLKEPRYNAQLSKIKPMEIETTDFESGTDTTAKVSESTFNRTDKEHFELNQFKKNTSDGTVISTVQVNAGSEKSVKVDRTHQDKLPVTDFKQSAAQPVPQAKTTSETGLNEKQQAGEGNSFPEKLKKADEGVEKSSKPSFDVQTQIPDIKHTEQSVRFNAEIEKLGDTQSVTEFKTSAASQISAGALDALKNGKNDFKLTLKPDGLGEIEVTMKLDGAGLSMKISTELQSTQKLISSQLPQLRQELAGGERNLTSLGVELKQNGFSAQNENAYSRQNEQRHTPNRAQTILYTGLDSDKENNITQQAAYGSKIYYRI